MSKLEAALEQQLSLMAVEPPQREYRFVTEHLGRPKGLRQILKEKGLKDWRFDFAWPEKRLAVEVEGGAWVQGRHTRGVGFANDLQKYHAAMSMGWIVYRCDGGLIRTGSAASLIKTLLEMRN